MSEKREFIKIITRCDECFGEIDQTGFCKLCGLEASDFKDRRFNKAVLAGAIVAGEEETRYRKARKVELKSGRANRGYVCNRCRDMFQDIVFEDSVVEQNSNLTGREEAGTNLFTFRLKQEYEDHVRLIHGGKRFADKANRKLGKYIKDTTADTFRGKAEK